MIAYEFYTGIYKGMSISEEEWPLFEARATEQLTRYKRIYSITAPEEKSEDLAVCAMADAMAYFTAAQNGAGGAVSSASVGSVSVSYGGVASGGVDISSKGQSKELYRCACQYLEIYRGVRGC